MNRSLKPVIVALDFPNLDLALTLADRLDPGVCRVKIGSELFTRAGPGSVRALIERGFDVFLDLKFHDIPNTVAGACRAAAELGCWMMNVHTGGGAAMMQAAREAIHCDDGPLLIGVTVLTSMGDATLDAVGVRHSPMDQVLRLARLAAEAGLDGVVCSPMELADLRGQRGFDFKLVTPGIRPLGAARGDQKRIATPAEAITAGADYLVVGRPLTSSDHPEEVLAMINAECATAADTRDH